MKGSSQSRCGRGGWWRYWRGGLADTSERKGEWMRVLVTGGRHYSDQPALFATLDGVHASRAITAVIHGGASGADRLAGRWGQARGVSVEVYPADWDKHGRAAGPIRNQEMLGKKPDLVVAFPGGKGTADMVRRAKAAGVKVVEVQG